MVECRATSGECPGRLRRGVGGPARWVFRQDETFLGQPGRAESEPRVSEDGVVSGLREERGAA